MTFTPFKKFAFILGASVMLQGCVAAVLGGPRPVQKWQRIPALSARK